MDKRSTFYPSWKDKWVYGYRLPGAYQMDHNLNTEILRQRFGIRTSAKTHSPDFLLAIVANVANRF